jgi:hypothetical protein
MTDPISPSLTRPLPYNQNPCIIPLLNFHGRVMNLCSAELADSEILCEIISRVVTVIISPFAYLALGFLALMGVVLNPCFSETITNNDQNRLQELPHHNLDQRLVEGTIHQRLVEKTIHQMRNSVENVDSGRIQGIRLFIKSIADEESLITQSLIQKENLELLDWNSIEERIISPFERTMSTLQENHPNPTNLKIEWIAFIKGSEGRLLYAHGDIETQNNSLSRQTEGGGLIEPDRFDVFAARRLQRFGIPPFARLDDIIPDRPNPHSAWVQDITRQMTDGIQNFSLGATDRLTLRNIQAIKLFIKSKTDERSPISEVKINAENEEGINRSSIEEVISETLAGVTTTLGCTPSFIHWTAFIKTFDGNFHSTEGNRSRNGSSTDGCGNGISAEDFQEYGALCLEGMGIPVITLLDGENNFV